MPWQIEIFSSELRGHFRLLFRGIENEELRSFFCLLFAGQYGAGAQGLNSLFRQAGILHLLVLSGSQIGHFTQQLAFLSRLCPGLRGTYFKSFESGLWGFFLLLYLTFAQCPAPLLRAAIFAVGRRCLPRLRLELLLPLTLLIHVLLQPSDLGGRSFYLSWLCFLALLFFDASTLPKWMGLVLLTVVAQAIVFLLCGGNLGPSLSWPLLIFSNLFWLWLFEFAVFPLGAWLVNIYLGWGLLAWICWGEICIGSAWVEGVKKIFSSLGELILGALKGFMYTS